MIVICSQCTTRLQLDDAKIPSRPFTVRCPKCQSIINGQPPQVSNNEQSALALGETPALGNSRYRQAMPAPAFKSEDEAADRADAQAQPASVSASEPGDLARMLVELLQKGVPVGEKQTVRAGRLAWERRRVLICVAPARRETIARLLVDEDYQVYVAEDTSQAIERMREEQMDIIILETEFDPVEQGAAFVTSEINTLRPAKRRRLLFVHLSPTARTLDAHAAFVSNVNLVVNFSDVEKLPRALERTIRDFNDLYHDFNTALNIAAL
ncbi:MAG TPA: zinc-ribbon domain-containing protein [Pyrinomonadaceae bacterium]|jgi:predicted Zn finger-like uncharacterized protein